MATIQSIDDDDIPPAGDGVQVPSKRAGKKRLILAAAAALVVAGAGGAAYGMRLFGKMGGDATATPGALDLPEIVSNLNAGSKRTSYVRIKARLELASKSDEPTAIAAEPRIQDLFQTYLRDMRPDELRGSAGTYRLREELLARVNIALAPARVTDILFVELLIQ